MNQSFRSKVNWFAGLFFRLLLVSILGWVSAHLLSSVFLRLGIGFHLFSGLMTIAMIFGYAWAIYYNFPFLQSHTKLQRLAVSTGLASIPLFIAYGCLFILARQFFEAMSRAQFSSPTNPVNSAYFYDGGFMDRDLWFYAQSDGQKTQFIANVWWSPECCFSDAQWTKDGKMIVCSLNVEVASNQPIMAIAFDFSANKSLVPPWMTKRSCDFKPEEDWRKQEANVKEMVVAHGGLSEKRITDETIRANEKKLWFWQTPP